MTSAISTVDVTGQYIGDLTKALWSNIYIAQSCFKSWKNNPEYEKQFTESFNVMVEHGRKIPLDTLRKLCEVTLETRLLFDFLIEAYKKGDFYGAILTGYGQEAAGAGLGLAMQKDDWDARDHRNVSLAIARGVPSLDFFLNHFMKATGPTGGYDPNVHFCNLEKNDLGFLASDMAFAVGLINGPVFARNRRKELEKGSELVGSERVAGVAIFGDGAASTGAALAGMNFAKAMRLPVLEWIHDNQLSLGTSGEEQHGGINLANRALGFEMPGVSLDGDDALAAYLVGYWLLHFARHASHPALARALTFRRHGHNESESTKYVASIFDEEFLKQMMSQDADPVTRIQKICQDFGVFKNGTEYEDFRDSIREKVARNYKEALSAPNVVADRKTMRSVFTDPDCKISKDLAAEHPISPSSRVITIREAIQEGLREELAKDPMLMMIGEDIGFPKGGVFNITGPLLEQFGDRIKNSPLDESAFALFAIGSAMAGDPVIAEYQFLNFAFAGISPVTTLAATRAFMMQTPVPIVLRGPGGRAPSSNNYHESLAIEACAAAAQGIKIAVISTPENAKGIIKSAIHDQDPVFIIEEIGYYGKKGEVPEHEFYTPLGVAAERRSGNDISIITWGPLMLDMAMQAAEKLSKDNIELDIIDLVTLVPLDKEAILRSVKKTGRVIILYEASKFMGFGAEVSATITEELTFYELKARPQRIASLNTPIPADINLEDLRLPQVDDIVAAARKIMQESL